MRVGDKVRVRGGRKVCRVARAINGRWIARACGHILKVGYDHLGLSAELRQDGTRFPLCKTCWPDGDGDAARAEANDEH